MHPKQFIVLSLFPIFVAFIFWFSIFYYFFKIISNLVSCWAFYFCLLVLLFWLLVHYFFSFSSFIFSLYSFISSFCSFISFLCSFISFWCFFLFFSFDWSINVCTLPSSSQALKSFSLGLILINSQSRYSFKSFCLLFSFVWFYLYGQVHELLLQVCILEINSQSNNLKLKYLQLFLCLKTIFLILNQLIVA